MQRARTARRAPGRGGGFAIGVRTASAHCLAPVLRRIPAGVADRLRVKRPRGAPTLAGIALSARAAAAVHAPSAAAPR